MRVVPQWILQNGEEACKLRDDQTFDAAIFTLQPEQVSHQCLHLQGQKTNMEQQGYQAAAHNVYFPLLSHC